MEKFIVVEEYKWERILEIEAMSKDHAMQIYREQDSWEHCGYDGDSEKVRVYIE